MKLTAPEKGLIAKEFLRVNKMIQGLMKTYNIVINYELYPVIEKESKDPTVASNEDSDGAIMNISRSGRGTQDKESFLFHFYPEQTKILKQNELRSVVMHELLHAVTWDYSDEFETWITHVKNVKLQEELVKRFTDVRENVTYKLERLFEKVDSKMAKS